jgi:hypothetical protein
MFDITVSDQNQMSPVYLFIQIQILIGFQPNRFVTKYRQKNPSLWNKLKACSYFINVFFGYKLNRRRWVLKRAFCSV